MTTTQTLAPTPAGTVPAPESRAAASRAEQARHRRNLLIVAAFGLALLLVALVALGIGRLAVPFDKVIAVIIEELAGLLGLNPSLATDATPSERIAVWQIRAPRVVLAIVVGAALAVSGAVLQSLFRNPLVSPDVIGVSSAASFGGVLSILLGLGGVWLVSGAFLAGLAAALLVLALGRLRTGSPILTIVLGGIVISALFNALVSLVA